jgi:hypothetical protein
LPIQLADIAKNGSPEKNTIDFKAVSNKTDEAKTCPVQREPAYCGCETQKFEKKRIAFGNYYCPR